VSFKADWAATGWNAPPTAPWLKSLLHATPRAQCFGREAAWMGEGGTIPFMNMLVVEIPAAQFLTSCGRDRARSPMRMGPTSFFTFRHGDDADAAGLAGIVAGMPARLNPCGDRTRAITVQMAQRNRGALEAAAPFR
jgi:hypothetical protein